jgi:hypothetical protein
MIKFGKRHNLLYPFIFVIFNDIRKIDEIIMRKCINFSGSFLLTFIMFFADSISGLLVYLYNLKYIREKKASKFMGIELIKAPSNIISPDKNIKIFFLLFLSSYIDFTEYFLSSFYIPREFENVSKSLELRLKITIICASTFFCYFNLKIPIFKHQIITIIIISVCLIIVIATEIIYYYHDSRILSDYSILVLMIIDHIFNSSIDIIEKYLLEYDFINPYLMLMLEGIFGLFFSFLFSFYRSPFIKIKKIYNKYNNDSESKDFIYLIICLIVYFFLSCGRNIYRVTTNKLYSPTTKALFDYILVPFLIIFYYVWDNDFQSNNRRLFFIFLINLIISIIVVFCGLIYNELIILFCCGLEYDTYLEVSKRAKKIETKAYELSGNESAFSSFFIDE